MLLIVVFTTNNLSFAQQGGQHYFDSLILRLPAITDAKQKVLALDTIGLYYKENDVSKALIYARQSLQLALVSIYPLGEGRARILLSQIYNTHTGDYEAAITEAARAKQLFTSVNDQHAIATACNQIGIEQAKLGRYDSATMYLLQAERLYEKVNDSEGMGLSYMNLGVIIEEEIRFDRSLDEALRYFSKALVCFEHMPGRKFEVLDNIGVIYGKKGDIPKALEYFNTILDHTNSDSTYAKIRVSSLTNCVTAYDAINRPADAMKCIDEALALSRRYDLPEEEALCLIDKGADLSRTDLKTGVALLYQGLEHAQKINNKRLQFQAYDNLIGVYEDSKDYKDAYKVLQEKDKFAQQVFNVEKAKKIEQLKELYEVEKKDDQIQLLNKDKALQALRLKNEKTSRNYLLAGIVLLAAFIATIIYSRDRRRKLTFQNKMSEAEMTALRAQMNPHFLFNSLNSVHSLLQDNNSKLASAYLIDLSKLARIVLENSLHTTIPLADELHAMELYFSLEARRLDKKMTYCIHVDQALDVDNILIPPLILQPFIENAILHGLQLSDTGGTIDLAITVKEGMLHCVIEDNGVGLQKAATLNTNSTAKRSLGTKLTDQRIAIINMRKGANAKVTITEILEADRRGTRVELDLPLETRF